MLIVIAETFGGWGFQAKLDDTRGIRIGTHSPSQEVNYGVNDKTGRYVNTGDANIYYEVYGEGRPVVLLHGGFAYIDQFKKYIPVLSKKFMVIAIATRGYGKSEIGTKRYSYELLADDVKAVIQQECQDKATVIGFSDGALIAYVIASKYPERVHKVVAMAGGALGTSGYTQRGLDWLKNFNSDEFEYYRPDFKNIMPQPERWDDFIVNLKTLWSTEYVLPLDNLRKITCPVLILSGDRDHFGRIERLIEVYKRIPKAQLAMIPNAGHIHVSPRNMTVFNQYVLPFIDRN